MNIKYFDNDQDENSKTNEFSKGEISNQKINDSISIALIKPGFILQMLEKHELVEKEQAK